MSERNKEKVFVIGLDGATLDLLTPLMDEGRMPFLSQLIGQGVLGELETTYPPVTAPAWPSFQTGKNPGKHGIYEVLYRKKGPVDHVPVKVKMLGGKTLWRLLSETRKRLGIVNVPLAYPPSEVSGFLLSGMMTPPSSENFAYPPELVRELSREVGEYVVHAGEGVLPSCPAPKSHLPRQFHPHSAQADRNFRVSGGDLSGSLRCGEQPCPGVGGPNEGHPSLPFGPWLSTAGWGGVWPDRGASQSRWLRFERLHSGEDGREGEASPANRKP